MRRIVTGALLALAGLVMLGADPLPLGLALAALGVCAWALRAARARVALGALAALALLAALGMGAAADLVALAGAMLLAAGWSLLVARALGAPPLHPLARLRGLLLAGSALLALVALLQIPLAEALLNGPLARTSVSLLLVAAALLLLAGFGQAAGRRNPDKGDEA